MFASRLSPRSARWLGVFLVVSLLIAASGCGPTAPGSARNNASPAAPPSSAAKKSRDRIRIGYLHVMDDAQVLLAKDAGLYEKHGLDAELQMFESGTDLIKAIVGGQLQAGVLGFTNAVTWADKGADLKVVGGAQMGYHSLLVRNDSGIRKVADLKGRRLASQKQGSTADIVLNGVVFPEAGLTRKDVQMVYVEPAAAIQALAAGQVDAAFVFEPYDSLAQKTLPVTSIYEIGKVWPFPCMVAITSGKELEKNRDVINRMLDAQKEAIEMLQNQPRKAAEYLAPRFVHEDSVKTPSGPLPAVDVIQQAIQSQTFNWRITADQVKRMQEVIDIMVKQGLLAKSLPVQAVLDLSWQVAQAK